MLALPLDERSRRLDDIHSLAPIGDAFFAWAARPGASAREAATPVFVRIKPGEDLMLGTTIGLGGRRDSAVHLKLRFATVDTTDLHLDRTVIFLQDVSQIENQAQQLKLASMGRLTASIAHEVRNPLSAISYAASLLAEEVHDPAQSRLLSIIGENVTRLNRMIEDILKLSRKAQSPGTPLELASTLAEIVAEFVETSGIERALIRVDNSAPHQVFFDPMHLREVVVNLLSNALRYASGNPGSICLRLVVDPLDRLELHVQDDGPAITPKVRAHLFEPFYTTSHKGTGLGLYMARELCMNNGAMLDYEYRAETVTTGGRGSGRFVILFAVTEAP
jgi:two-component system sensor histidine kinase PilS (NtrC family)